MDVVVPTESPAVLTVLVTYTFWVLTVVKLRDGAVIPERFKVPTLRVPADTVYAVRDAPVNVVVPRLTPRAPAMKLRSVMFAVVAERFPPTASWLATLSPVADRVYAEMVVADTFCAER